MTSVVILGSTGSIGTQALELAASIPDEIRVAGLAAGSNVDLFVEQVRQWRPEVAVMFSESAYRAAHERIGTTATKLLCGMDGLREAATWPGVDIVLGAMLGAAGLQPTLAALEIGRDIAIANKETLVAAGELVMATARASGAHLWPVDSEHSALGQCLLGEDPASVARLAITASGGPFAEWSREQIAAAKPTQALKHPTWTMGRKITIDSATLMNKGLEMIEAHWLFNVPMDRIDVVVHRQSIIHSFVTFTDNSVKAQMGVPDMKLPIQWGLLRGRRVPGGGIPHLNLWEMGPLTFTQPDKDRFPSVELAREAMRLGGTAPAALNAANEVAVAAFLDGKTSFYGITEAIAQVLEQQSHGPATKLDEILAADGEARHRTREYLGVES